MKSLFGILFLFMFSFAIAQDSTDSTGSGSGISLPGNWTLYVSIALGLYELIVRFFPTIKSYSIVTFVVRILNYVFPDKRAKKINQETDKF